MTFLDAANELVEWVHVKTRRDMRPHLVNSTADQNGLLIVPWTLDTPRSERSGRRARLMATARFALCATGGSVDEILADWDSIFFAAIDDPVWRVSETSAPQALWPKATSHSLTLACDIYRNADGHVGGIVRKPLVFDISTSSAPDAPAATSHSSRRN